MLYPPRPNELLSSWIIRNSIMQGSDPMGWVYGFWGEWRAWTRDIDRYLPKERAVELSRFSRLSLESISEMTLTPITIATLGKMPKINRAWEWIVPTGRRNRHVVSGLQFCPECLKEDPTFFPRDWRLSWHTQCSKHSIRFHDRCDRCAMPFSPHLIDFTAPHTYLCSRCGNDLRTMHTHPSSKQSILFQEKLEEVLASPEAIQRHYPQWSLTTTEDFFLFLRDLLILSVILSRNEDRFEDWQVYLFAEKRFSRFLSKAGLSFDMRSVEERESLLLIAFQLLESTPENLIKSLRHIQLTQGIFTRQTFPHSPYMHRLLSTLPIPATVTRRKMKAPHTSKEPKSPDTVKEQMATIKRFL